VYAHAASYFKELFTKSIVTNFDGHISTNKTVSNCKVSVNTQNQSFKKSMHIKQNYHHETCTEVATH